MVTIVAIRVEKFENSFLNLNKLKVTSEQLFSTLLKFKFDTFSALTKLAGSPSKCFHHRLH